MTHVNFLFLIVKELYITGNFFGKLMWATCTIHEPPCLIIDLYMRVI